MKIIKNKIDSFKYNLIGETTKFYLFFNYSKNWDIDIKIISK